MTRTPSASWTAAAACAVRGIHSAGTGGNGRACIHPRRRVLSHAATLPGVVGRRWRRRAPSAARAAGESGNFAAGETTFSPQQPTNRRGATMSGARHDYGGLVLTIGTKYAVLKVASSGGGGDDPEGNSCICVPPSATSRPAVRKLVTALSAAGGSGVSAGGTGVADGPVDVSSGATGGGEGRDVVRATRAVGVAQSINLHPCHHTAFRPLPCRNRPSRPGSSHTWTPSTSPIQSRPLPFNSPLRWQTRWFCPPCKGL